MHKNAVSAYLGLIYALYVYLMRSFGPLQWGLLAASAGIIVLPIGLAHSGVSMTTCLLVLMTAPMVTVVGYELVGHRQQDHALKRLQHEE